MEYKFNSDTRYVTRGINTGVPIVMQLLIWKSIDDLIESDTKADYLQVFRFKLEKSGIFSVSHTQENPVFKNIIEIDMKEEYLSLDGITVFVIDDIDHSTALLSNEY